MWAAGESWEPLHDDELDPAAVRFEAQLNDYVMDKTACRIKVCAMLQLVCLRLMTKPAGGS